MANKTMTLGNSSNTVNLTANGNVVGANIKSKGNKSNPVYFDENGIAVPINGAYQAKKYTGIYSLADNDANHYFFYGKIVPTSYKAIWRVKVKIHGYVPTNADYNAVYEFNMSGMRNTYCSYYCWNSIQNTSYRPIWYQTLRFASSEANALNTGHLIGVSLTSAPNRTSTSYKRDFDIEILETENCTVSLFDSMSIIGNVPNSGNYGGNSNFNATDNGLQETGDANTYDRTYFGSNIITNGGSDRLCRYSILGFDRKGNAQPISTYSAGYTSYTTSLNTARVYNTNGFDYTRGLFYMDSNFNLAPNTSTTSGASMFFAITGMDLRYSDNVVYSYNPNTFGFVRGKFVYIRGVIKSDGLFYVAPYPKDAIIVDGYYKSASTFVTTSGGSTNISNYHAISGNYVYRDITSGKYYKYASSTYTQITDLTPYKNYQKAWTQTIPTSVENDADGNQYMYILVGMPYYSSSYADGAYQLNLFKENPVYWYHNGRFEEYKTSASADKLNVSAGSATQPIYFKDGVPTATSYTLEKSVPSDAKFTDTNTTYTNGTGLTLSGTEFSVSSANASTIINQLTTGTSDPNDNDYYVAQYSGGGSTTTSYHRRPHSALWNYIKGKISSVLGLTATNYGGKSATAGNADTVNGKTVAVNVPADAKFTDTNTVTTATTTGSGNAVTSVSASNGALTVTKGSTFVDTSSNQTIGGIKTFSAKGLVADVPTNTVVGVNASSYYQSPIPKYLWHDILSFCRITGVPKYYTTTNNTTWTEAVCNTKLFAQKENQAYNIISPTGKTGSRWVWSAGMSWSSASWMLIASTYSATVATVNVVIETSADGETWAVIHSSTNSTGAAPYWCKIGAINGNQYLRLTITKDPSDTTKSYLLSSIKLLTTRWGDQGLGSEYESPFEWDENQNIYPDTNDTKTLGTSSRKWSTVYATTFNGNATSATTASKSNSLSAQPQIDGDTALDNFIEGGKFKYSTFKNSAKAGMASNDGMVLSVPWISDTYGSQIAFDDSQNPKVKIRGKSTTWGEWKEILHEGNLSTLLPTVATSGSYNDLSNKPSIPSEVTESTVSGWGFTKNTGTLTTHQSIKTLHNKTLTGTGNVTLTASDVGALPSTTTIPTVTDTYSSTSSNAMSGKAVASAISGKGTYSKPSGGIPKSDLASAVQTSLGKADTALQSYTEQYTGTVKSVNGNTPDANGNVTIPTGVGSGGGTITGVTAGANMSGGGTSGSVTINHATPTGASAKSSGLYKISTDSQGHVTGATSVTKNDITGLGIPSENTTYSDATISAPGLMSSTDKGLLDNLASAVNVNIGESNTTVKIADSVDDVTLGNLKIATYRTIPITWNTGTTQYSSDDTKAFVRKFKDCRIYGMIGCFHGSNGNLYPASSPMFNTSGSYSATWGHKFMINTSNESLDVTVPTQWANYRACVTVVYGVD